MSWSFSATGTAPEIQQALRADYEEWLAKYGSQHSPEVLTKMAFQFIVALEGAVALMPSVPATRATITVSGHANGLGDKAPPENWSPNTTNICISRAP